MNSKMKNKEKAAVKAVAKAASALNRAAGEVKQLKKTTVAQKKKSPNKNKNNKISGGAKNTGPNVLSYKPGRDVMVATPQVGVMTKNVIAFPLDIEGYIDLVDIIYLEITAVDPSFKDHISQLEFRYVHMWFLCIRVISLSHLTNRFDSDRYAGFTAVQYKSPIDAWLKVVCAPVAHYLKCLGICEDAGTAICPHFEVILTVSDNANPFAATNPIADAKGFATNELKFKNSPFPIDEQAATSLRSFIEAERNPLNNAYEPPWTINRHILKRPYDWIRMSTIRQKRSLWTVQEGLVDRGNYGFGFGFSMDLFDDYLRAMERMSGNLPLFPLPINKNADKCEMTLVQKRWKVETLSYYIPTFEAMVRDADKRSKKDPYHPINLISIPQKHVMMTKEGKVVTSETYLGYHPEVIRLMKDAPSGVDSTFVYTQLAQAFANLVVGSKFALPASSMFKAGMFAFQVAQNYKKYGPAQSQVNEYSDATPFIGNSDPGSVNYGGYVISIIQWITAFATMGVPTVGSSPSSDLVELNKNLHLDRGVGNIQGSLHEFVQNTLLRGAVVRTADIPG
jgi:hypothetical protein